MNTPTPTPRPALKATGMRRRHARCLETELAAIGVLPKQKKGRK
jgi:hypothetical protein